MIMVISDDSKVEDQEKDEEKPNLKGDYANISLLFLLYVLQGKAFDVLKQKKRVFANSSGVPMGMTSSMSVMLQNRGISYTEQTFFSIAVYPFTRKSKAFLSYLTKSFELLQ